MWQRVSRHRLRDLIDAIHCSLSLSRFGCCDAKNKAQPPWPNGQGVGPRIRRLRVRVPQGVLSSLQHRESPRFGVEERAHICPLDLAERSGRISSAIDWQDDNCGSAFHGTDSAI